MTVAGLLTVLMAIAAFSNRRRLSSNRINRQLAWAVVSLPFVITVSRVTGWVANVSLDGVVIIDLLAVSWFAVAATIIDTRLRWLLPPALAAPLVASIQPESAMLVEGVTYIVMSLGAGWIWRRQNRAATDPLQPDTAST